MALRRSDVEASIKVAEAQLSAAEAKYKEKAKGKHKLKKHPVWRAANSKLKEVKKRLVAIEKLATREAALKEKKSAKTEVS